MVSDQFLVLQGTIDLLTSGSYRPRAGVAAQITRSASAAVAFVEPRPMSYKSANGIDPSSST